MKITKLSTFVGNEILADVSHLFVRAQIVYHNLFVKYFQLSNSDKMAPSFLCPLPTTTAKRLEELYTVHGVDRAVVVDLASTAESPEASLSLVFWPALGLSLTQMCPNFLRHLLALLVKAREEGLLFGLDELRHLGIPYRDQNWREEFFVFKIDEASVGSFDFSRLPRYWAEDIVHSGRSDMTDGLRGLIGALRRGRSNWSSFDRARIRAAFLMPEGSGVAPEIAGALKDELELSGRGRGFF
ncbi:hypothetical protein F2Q68_00036381 [Brassica cretica]|uniref:Uncharacterized protein n=1 Tax=Brassica cretica TaxID=69181 RepID=A0A8S9GW59_BRACR|nr:hypothetical protein F2Q68_00036381 [Brassica cretica]